jgi:hypothetical protein
MAPEVDMAIWGRLKEELDRASRVAQGAVDEGRVRLELFRARQRADRAAQAFGYAVHRAAKEARELAPDERDRLSAEVTRAELEIERLESQLATVRGDGGANESVTVTPPGAP